MLEHGVLLPFVTSPRVSPSMSCMWACEQSTRRFDLRPELNMIPSLMVHLFMPAKSACLEGVYGVQGLLTDTQKNRVASKGILHIHLPFATGAKASLLILTPTTEKAARRARTHRENRRKPNPFRSENQIGPKSYPAFSFELKPTVRMIFSPHVPFPSHVGS